MSWRAVPLVLILACAAAGPVAAKPQPAANELRAGARVVGRLARGIVETVVADSIADPVCFAIADDGRVFVAEQGGALRVIRDGRMLARPFVVVPTRADVEEGLIGVALHPDFARNGWVYVLSTAGPEPRRERLERWTASGDTALAGSGAVLIELDPHVANNHVGGGLRFMSDGRLLIGTGDNEQERAAQSLGSTFGKLLRLEDDGRIPPDNPFLENTTGHRQAIWARGFRNAFAFDVQRSTGRVFVNDVGGSAWEEIDEAVAGGNYGWPLFEGPSEAPGYRSPIRSYMHDQGCAITGGAFYEPGRPLLPREWVGRYFYLEYCWNEIRWLDPLAPERGGLFGTTLVPGPVDVHAGPDGALWVLLRGNSAPVGGAGTALGMLVRIEAKGAGARRNRQAR